MPARPDAVGQPNPIECKSSLIAPQQAGAKMKFMYRPVAILDPHRFGPDVFKLVQADARVHLSIETGGAQFAIPIPGRTKVDGVVA